jgi:hypothetical protein
VPRLTSGNTKVHCASSFDTVWVDIDRGPATDPDSLLNDLVAVLRPLGLLPSATVYSGNKGIHLYWKLVHDISIDRLESYNKAFSQLLDGDHAPTHRATLLRNPGTQHQFTGNMTALLTMSAEIHPVARLAQLPPAYTPPSQPRPPPRGALGGWGERDLDLSELALWEQWYMMAEPRPRQGYTHNGQTRNQIEMWIVNRLVGKQFGASDAQIHQVALEYFPKAQEKYRKSQGKSYVSAMLLKARERYYESGWITSPLGGWPKERDAKYRHATTDDLEAMLNFVDGSPRRQWVEKVMAIGYSQASAYRWAASLRDLGLVYIEGNRMHRTGECE